jgi:hypothetical protein
MEQGERIRTRILPMRAHVRNVMAKQVQMRLPQVASAGSAVQIQAEAALHVTQAFPTPPDLQHLQNMAVLREMSQAALPAWLIVRNAMAAVIQEQEQLRIVLAATR